jgi:rhodanese-related sulfurtransferase
LRCIRPAATDGIGIAPPDLEAVAAIPGPAPPRAPTETASGRRGRLQTVSETPGAAAVDPTEAHERLDAGAVLLDVREPDEWMAGHAPEATWIPMRELAGRQAELPSDRPIVVVCRSGERSGRVALALQRAGYDAANLTGGLLAWAHAGLPVVTDDGGTGTVT